jgi:hypothetical protein
MQARSQGSRTTISTAPLLHVLRIPSPPLPHPFTTLAVFATDLATFATSCRTNQPSSPMNPRIVLKQNQKAAKTAMLTIPVNIIVTAAVNLLSPPLLFASSPPCPSLSSVSSVLNSPLSSASSASSAVQFSVPFRHGRLTCDPADAYSTGAIWDRLPNLSRAAARTPTRARHGDHDDRGPRPTAPTAALRNRHGYSHHPDTG